LLALAVVPLAITALQVQVAALRGKMLAALLRAELRTLVAHITDLSFRAATPPAAEPVAQTTAVAVAADTMGAAAELATRIRERVVADMTTLAWRLALH
jgi:hypothetical protein